jgi:hypothetical protein
MRFSAKLLGITIAFFLVFFVSKVSFAQTNSPFQNPQAQYLTPNTNPDVQKNLHTYAQNVMIEVMSAMTCQLAGVDPISPNGQCLGLDQKTGKLGYVQGNGGVPVFLGKMITVLYTPPIQTSQYVQYLSQNFGIAKPSYAQTTGIGFNQLSPLIALWTKFRDMTYILFVFLFVIVGIAIMLRVKIDPRTVMTIQNQIPKLIIGIILVTLSFPIAGFMVDLMWVSTYTIVSVISSADPLAQPGDFQTQITNPPLVFANNYFTSNDSSGGLHHVASDASNVVNDSVIHLFDNNVVPVAPSQNAELGTDQCAHDNGPLAFFCPIGQGISQVVGGAINAIVTAVGSIANLLSGIVRGLFGAIVGFVAFLIIIIAIIYSLFKLWFALIKTYIMILIDVIFAPFWIIGGLLPGATSLGFTSWLRNLGGNLAVFPAVIALFAIGRVFVDSFGPNTPADKMFIPPLIGNVAQGSNIIASLIALGIILASPSVVDMVKKAFKGPAGGGGGGGGGGLLGGAAMGAALGVGAKVVGTPLGKARNAAFGTDPKTGQAKFGSAYIGRKFGGAAQAFTGGGVRGTSQWIKNPGTGPVGRVARGVGSKVIAPVASKAAQVVTAIPVVGPVVGGVATVTGKVAGKVATVTGKVAGKVTSPIRRATGRINTAVPHLKKEDELDAMEGKGTPPTP